MPEQLACGLGFLDFGLIPIGGNATSTLDCTLKSALLADRLGFATYWLAEHYHAQCAWGNPIPLLPVLAATTDRIIVGTAGNLINAYAPVAIASDYSLLTHLFPSRIDFGIARGIPSTNAKQLFAADPASITASDFASRVREVLQRLSLLPDLDESYDGGVKALPEPGPPLPRVWILGTSDRSAHIAADCGTAYGTSLFHFANPNTLGVDVYRQEYKSRTPGGATDAFSGGGRRLCGHQSRGGGDCQAAPQSYNITNRCWHTRSVRRDDL